MFRVRSTSGDIDAYPRMMWWENHIVLIQNIDTWHAQSRNIRNTFSSVFRSFPIIFLGFPIMFKSHCQYIFHRLVVSERFPAHGWSPIDHTRPTRLSCSCHAKHLVLEQVVRHVFVGDASRKGAKGQKKKTPEAKIFGKTEYWMYWHIKMKIIQDILEY